MLDLFNIEYSLWSTCWKVQYNTCITIVLLLKIYCIPVIKMKKKQYYNDWNIHRFGNEISISITHYCGVIAFYLYCLELKQTKALISNVNPLNNSKCVLCNSSCKCKINLPNQRSWWVKISHKEKLLKDLHNNKVIKLSLTES